MNLCETLLRYCVVSFATVFCETRKDILESETLSVAIVVPSILIGN